MSFDVVGSFLGALVNFSASKREYNAQIRAARRNAEMARAYGRNRAEWARWAAQQNSNYIKALTGMNAGLTLGMGEVDAAKVMSDAKYNASMIYLYGMYNAALIDEERNALREEYKLTKSLAEVQTEQDAAQIMTKFAGSGIRITGDVDEAPGKTFKDHYVEAAVQELMLTISAEVQADKFLNMAAQTRWEAATKAQATEISGYNEAIMSRINSYSQATGIFAEGFINSKITEMQGEIEASHHIAQAELNYRKYIEQMNTSKAGIDAARFRLWGELATTLMGAAGSVSWPKGGGAKASGGGGGAGGTSPRPASMNSGFSAKTKGTGSTGSFYAKTSKPSFSATGLYQPQRTNTAKKMKTRSRYSWRYDPTGEDMYKNLLA